MIEQVMEREKGMYPNVDWPAGRLYHAMALEIPIYTPMFAMSRVVGWSAHIIEQLENNRLICPSRRYIGEGDGGMFWRLRNGRRGLFGFCEIILDEGLGVWSDLLSSVTHE